MILPISRILVALGQKRKLGRKPAEGIDCTLVKGIAFGFTIYAEHAVRPMNDIDLWIKKSDLSAVQRLMYEMGYRGGEWLDPENVPDYVTELSFSLYMMQRYHISSRMLLPLYYGK